MFDTCCSKWKKIARAGFSPKFCQLFCSQRFISPQLPLKHNRCLPTRLPSTSCLVTGSPLLSTTERLTNSMSGLNLETPLIHPPHWIDRSWLHRGRRSPTVACLIFTLGTAFLVLKSKAASYYKQRSPITSVPRWKK